MDAAEFACLREGLGLSVRWVSEWLGVSERTLKRWEDGLEPIPGGVVEALWSLDLVTIDAVREKVAEHPKFWVTYRTDADALEGDVWYAPTSRDGGPTRRFPASWHRAVTDRARREVGGLITYYVPQDERV